MFETTVVESRRRRGSARKLLTLPVSLAAHSLAIGGVVFATVWSVDFPTNPPSQLVQYAVVAPPPPPPPPAPRKAPPKVETPEIPKNVQEMAPAAIPETISEAGGTEGGIEGGIEGGVEGGEEGGVMGGVVGGLPLQEPRPPEPEGPLRVGGDVQPPVIIQRVNPVYPEIARRSRVSGVVIVEAIIDKQGQVKNARVLRGQPMGLNEAALRAVEQWRFRPGTRHGQPVEVYFVLTVNFTILGA